MKLLVSLIFSFYSSLSISQITHTDFSKIYDKVLMDSLKEETINLQSQYRNVFTNEYKKIFLSDQSREYFYNAFEKNLLKTYIEGEKFGAAYATLIRVEGTKRLIPSLQKQQTLCARKVLNYANAKECSAIIQNIPITKDISSRSGVELYARLPIDDFTKYFETYTKSAYLIFNGKDESIAIKDDEIEELNKIFISNLKKLLTEEKLKLYISVIANGFSQSKDEDVCEVGKLILDTMLTAGNAQQSELIINAWIKGRLLKK